MERLINISNNLGRRVPTEFYRYMFDKVEWTYQLIGISGARGSGKSVMLLQYLKQISNNALYVSMDDIFFSENKLVYFAEDFHRKGGEILILDEVHKYSNWSQEIKNIYDSLPDLKVIFTSSSALEIYKGSHDLSRRVILYHLAGLSFREFIELKYKIKLPIITLTQILNNDNTYIDNVLQKIKPIKLFNEYLEYGYYPFFINVKQSYLKQILNTINLVIENDLPAIHHIDFNSIIKIKKMLSILSRIVPYKPNIEELASQIGTTRDTLLKFLFYLEKAQIIKWLGKDTKGINYLNKPDKLYLHNTNLAFALSDSKPDIGNMRETFFLNQLSVNHQVSYPEVGDFLIDGKFLFEIGGKNKTKKQIIGIENSFVVTDNTEYIFENKIPLWLFGLMY